MQTVVILINFAIAGAIFLVAWRLWQFRWQLRQISTQLDQSFDAASQLRRLPDQILLAQRGTAAWRHQQAHLWRQIQRLQQLLGLWRWLSQRRWWR